MHGGQSPVQACSVWSQEYLEGGMTLKLIVLKCPTCGAYVDVKEGSSRAVCAYCDTPFFVEDEQQEEEENESSGRAEDAEERAEAARKPKTGGDPSRSGTEHAFEPGGMAHAFEEAWGADADAKYLRRQKRWQRSIVIFAAAVLITLLARNGTLFWIVFVFGLIVIAGSHPRSRRTGTRLHEDAVYSDKSQMAALVLCILLGIFGAHYFYVGKIGKGILYLLTIGLFGIGWMIDIIRIACGVFTDSSGFRLKG